MKGSAVTGGTFTLTLAPRALAAAHGSPRRWRTALVRAGGSCESAADRSELGTAGLVSRAELAP